MSRTTTLLTGAIKGVNLAKQAIMGIPGYDEHFAELAWELDNIKTRLEIKYEEVRASDERAGGEQLELGE